MWHWGMRSVGTVGVGGWLDCMIFVVFFPTSVILYSFLTDLKPTFTQSIMKWSYLGFSLDECWSDWWCRCWTWGDAFGFYQKQKIFKSPKSGMRTHQSFSVFFLINRLASKCSDNWNRLNLDNRFGLRLLQKYVWILICLAVCWHLKVMLSSSSGARLQGVENTICLGLLHA